MPSKKLQVTVEEEFLEQINNVMKEEMYFEMSEFVKHCIRSHLKEWNERKAKPS